jgi:hypothetical protein
MPRNGIVPSGAIVEDASKPLPANSHQDPAGVSRSTPLYRLTGNDNKKVAYFYDSDIGNYAYVTGHPMKPHRIRLAHSLVMNYNVYKYLEVYVSPLLLRRDGMARWHHTKEGADDGEYRGRNPQSLAR